MKWTKAVTKAIITLVVLPATAIAVATAALVVPALNPSQEQTTTQSPTTTPTTNVEPTPTPAPKDEQVVDAPGTAYHGHTVASLILQAEANKAVAQPQQQQQQVTSFVSSIYTPSKRPKPPTTSRPARTEGGGNKPKKRAKAPKSVVCQGYYPECPQTESREQELAMLEYDKRQALAASVPVFKPVPSVPKLLDDEGNITEAEKPLTQFPEASYSVEVQEKSTTLDNTTNEAGE